MLDVVFEILGDYAFGDVKKKYVAWKDCADLDLRKQRRFSFIISIVKIIVFIAIFAALAGWLFMMNNDQ